MAFRTIEVTLQANVAAFQRGMGTASAEVRKFAMVAASGDQAVQQFSRVAGIAGLAIAAGLGVAVKAAANFDKAMSEVAAVAGASSAEMKLLRDAAIEAGAATAFSASEAAKAQAELVKAGIGVQDVLAGGLAGALDLAAAGSLDLGQAAEIASQAMNVFELSGRDVTHIADLLSAGANKSAADVAQLGDALRQGGLVAAQTGLSIEETVGALSMFADRALVGSDAGTSLKSMLQRLTPQSKEAATLMEELGFSAFDASGEFIGLEGLAKELQTSLAGMSTEQRNAAMSTLFGADAIRAANVLFSEGSDGVRDYVAAVNDQGAAADMAAEKLDNLAGDFEELGGSIETALIKNGSIATGTLRALTQGATGAVNAFSGLPMPLQAAVTGTAALASTGLLAIGVIGTMAPKIMHAREALEKMGAAGQFANRHMGSFAAGIGKATVALGVLYTAGAILDSTVNRLQEADLSQLENSLLGLGRSGDLGGEGVDALGQDFAKLAEAIERVAAPSVISQADHAINTISTIGGLLGRGKGDLEQATQRIDDLDKALASLALVDADAAADALSEIEGAVDPEVFDRLLPLLDDYDSALAGIDTAAKTAGPSIASTTEVVQDQEEAAKRTEEAINALSDAWDALIGVNLSAESAAIAVEGAFADLPGVLKENGASLDLMSEAGRANREALSSTTDAALRHAQALSEQGASTEVVSAHLSGYASRLAETMRQAGYSEEAIAGYIATIGLTPQNVDTLVQLHGTAQAEGQLETLTRDRAVTVRVQVTEAIGRSVASIARSITGNRHGGLYEFAAGGTTGPHIAPPVTIHKYAEPETGGEAYIPKNGDRARSLGILSAAAAWHDAEVVPFATGGHVGQAVAATHARHAFEQRGSALALSAGYKPEDLARMGTAWADLAEQVDEATATMLLSQNLGVEGYAEAARRIGDSLAQQKQDHEDLVRFLDEHYEQRQTQLDIAHAEEALSAEEYLAVLADRHDRLVEMYGYWSQEAHAVRNEIRDVNDGMVRDAEEATDELQRVEDVRHQVGEISTERYLAILQERLTGEKRYSTEWLAISQNIAEIRQEAFDHLNDLLDQQERIQTKIEQSRADHHAKLRRLERDLADDRAKAIADRAADLRGWTSIEERSVVSWGNTVGALTRNVTDQIGQFTEWQAALADARARGVSEAVIGMLGLDEGPEALGQLRMFASATDTEIADLNAAVAERQEQAGHQARWEAEQSYTELGGMLVDMADRFAAEVEALNEAFLAEQAGMAAELAAIGSEQGRSYSDAIEAGIRSGIPGIIAAGEAARSAAAAANAALAAELASAPTTATAPAATTTAASASEAAFLDWYNASAANQEYYDWKMRGYATGTASVPFTGLALVVTWGDVVPGRMGWGDPPMS